MGSGGRADVGARGRAPAPNNNKIVEAYAFADLPVDFELPPNWQDALAPLPESEPLCTDDYNTLFEDAQLDEALWADATASNPAPPFGSLAVDEFFKPEAFIPRMPASPLSGTFSPLCSPLRAPGSPCRHAAPVVLYPTNAEPFSAKPAAADLQAAAPIPVSALAAAAPSAAPVPLISSTTIPSCHAHVDTDVLVVCTPRVPKRPREQEDDCEALDSADSEDSAVMLQSEDIPGTVLEAVPYTSQAEVVEALERIPTQQQTPLGEIVTLSPTLWRGVSPPFRIHVNMGVRSMRAPEAEAPVTWFTAMHPRCITTGVPHRRLGRTNPYRRVEAAAPPVTRSTRAHGAERYDRAAPTELRREKVETCALQEVWLLKRSAQKGEAHRVLEAHRCTGPFEGTTVDVAPEWPGVWAVDVVALVADPAGSTFWLKAPGRSVQDFRLQEPAAC